jgi:hypothetical protein
MQALTPLSAPQALIASAATVARDTPQAPARMAIRRDLELDCLNESESRPSPSDDAHCEMKPRRRAPHLRLRDQHHLAVGAGDHVSAMRYGDVGLLLGLCSPAPLPAPAGCPRSARTDIEDDDILPLLLKYTHVVGAS